MADPYVTITNIALGTSLALNQISTSSNSVGIEAQPGMTGLGLPPITVLTDDGAGDGALYRGRTVGARVIDLPVEIVTADRAALVAAIDSLAVILDGRVYLDVTVPESGGQTWRIVASLTGGGDYAYGSPGGTNGFNHVTTTLTFQSESPYWELQASTTGSVNATGPLVVSNPGTVPTPPVWTVNGPTLGFRLDYGDKSLSFNGMIRAGVSVTVDAVNGTVVDSNGVNRYADLASFPSFFGVKAGVSTVNVTLDQSSSAYQSAFGSGRTNRITNPRFQNDTTNWTLASSLSYDSTNDRLTINTGGNPYAFRPRASTTVTGLTVGATYMVRLGLMQSSIKPPAYSTVLPGNMGVIDGGVTKSQTIAYTGSSMQEQVFTFVADSTSVSVFWQPAVAQDNKTGKYTVFANTAYLKYTYCGEPGTYFDGATPDTAQMDYSWSGTADASTSRALDLSSAPTTGASASVSFKPRKWAVI